ncbi:dTDP-4-dehydrorhamnose reductase [Maribacter algarum]|uniref:dTDP-4-dehydrorhamnose reductase n=1 Tax=Maribacter algarum (ex Zhang et al. 2020) TaxID=2578118 RepID=A0A5S3PVE8_9FLAO|nr:dTDP-4-dehydrorhamnose reductase [Maribacter algarum]TMM58955.1 dTDP-4-dehydrorhamnose reductase [Maribacter algarum]
MIRILVTGSDGQLGKCIQKIVPKYSKFEFVFHNSKTFDITNPELITEVFSKENFDYCINCAAYTNVEQAEKTPKLAFAINAEAVRHLSLACFEYKVSLVHISTDYVFDGEKKSPYTTSDKTNPINEYGKSKLAGERHIQNNLKEHFIIRTSWLYSEFGKNFYKTIVEKAKTESVLNITDEQTGCPTNANNLAAYILNLVARNGKNYGIQHFTDGEAMTWYDFAKLILKENKLDKNVRLDRAKNYRTFAKRPRRSILE